MKEIKINKEYITLGQLLQIVDIAYSGGQAKFLVKELEIYVDKELENRRGRKLYSGNVVDIKGYGKYLIK